MLKIHKQSEYSIYCENCETMDFIQNCDGNYKWNDSPSAYFKRLGWREINNKTMCPECANRKKE